MAQNVTSTTEEKVSVSFAPTTPKGKPGLIDGSITAVVESGGATVENDADGKPAFIVSEDAPGQSVIRFSADADLTSGVATIEELVTYGYTDPQVTNLGLSFGTAVPK